MSEPDVDTHRREPLDPTALMLRVDRHLPDTLPYSPRSRRGTLYRGETYSPRHRRGASLTASRGRRIPRVHRGRAYFAARTGAKLTELRKLVKSPVRDLISGTAGSLVDYVAALSVLELVACVLAAVTAVSLVVVIILAVTGVI